MEMARWLSGHLSSTSSGSIPSFGRAMSSLSRVFEAMSAVRPHLEGKARENGRMREWLDVATGDISYEAKRANDLEQDAAGVRRVLDRRGLQLPAHLADHVALLPIDQRQAVLESLGVPSTSLSAGFTSDLPDIYRVRVELKVRGPGPAWQVRHTTPTASVSFLPRRSRRTWSPRVHSTFAS